jgi:hypothetical protein
VPDLRSRALAYLRGHNVAVVRADPCEERARPVLVWARVHGHYGCHKVTLLRWQWSCRLELPDGAPDPRPLAKQEECHAGECPHVAAVQLVTGHRSLAQRLEPTRGRRDA